MINISGAPPNSLSAGPPAPPYEDNYSGPANPECFLKLDALNDWGGQSFTTPNFKYNLLTVELWLKKGPGANVGTVRVYLFPVDGSGHPTGSLFNYGSIFNADISEDYSWVSCLLDYWPTCSMLSAATKYCIVVRGLDVTGFNHLIWACGGEGSDYPGGDQEWSTNGGGIWSTDNTKDQLFRCYRTPWLDNYSGSSLPFSGSNLFEALRWFGQSFTAMKSYPLNRIDLHINKSGFVGNIIVGLYNVDMFGHPFGFALATGIIPDADIPTEKTWVKCWMSGCNIAIDEKYCIVVHGGDSLNMENQLVWSWDEYGGSDYAGGDFESSLNGGETWSTVTDKDFLFRCYPK
jgi:hypothetical protein